MSKPFHRALLVVLFAILFTVFCGVQAVTWTPGFEWADRAWFGLGLGVLGLGYGLLASE